MADTCPSCGDPLQEEDDGECPCDGGRRKMRASSLPGHRPGIRASMGWLEEYRYGNVPSVYVGPSKRPERTVNVSIDQQPVLAIHVSPDEETMDLYSEVLIWHGMVFVGYCQRLDIVDIDTMDTTSVPLHGYFGKLYSLDDCVLVADMGKLVCIERDRSIRWTSPELGVDGVLVHDVTDHVISGDGEWNPPGAWYEFRLNRTTGEIMDNMPDRTRIFREQYGIDYR